MYVVQDKRVECSHCFALAERTSLALIDEIPELRRKLGLDVQAAYAGDPAAKSTEEVIVSYPGLEAICVYRIAHFLTVNGVPVLPRIMTEYAHGHTGIDINPGAKIGERFFSLGARGNRFAVLPLQRAALHDFQARRRFGESVAPVVDGNEPPAGIPARFREEGDARSAFVRGVVSGPGLAAPVNVVLLASWHGEDSPFSACFKLTPLNSTKLCSKTQYKFPIHSPVIKFH